MFPKEVGGLGLKHLRKVNKALLGKWLSRFAIEKEALWREVVVCEYGKEEGDWWAKWYLRPHGVGIWKSIMGVLFYFPRKVKFMIGNNERVKFWTDVRCGYSVLIEQFPQFYNIGVDREGWVADFINWVGETPTWNVTFIRHL